MLESLLEAHRGEWLIDAMRALSTGLSLPGRVEPAKWFSSLFDSSEAARPWTSLGSLSSSPS